MTSEDRPPDPDELLAMAYADGELDASTRAEFEARLGSDRPLARRVAEQQRLNLMMRSLAPPEPKDAAWAELNADALHRAGLSTGHALIFAGAAGALGLLGWGLVTNDAIPLPWKLALGALGVGLAALFLTVLRARLRTLPYDPYTSIER